MKHEVMNDFIRKQTNMRINICCKFLLVFCMLSLFLSYQWTNWIKQGYHHNKCLVCITWGNKIIQTWYTVISTFYSCNWVFAALSQPLWETPSINQTKNLGKKRIYVTCFSGKPDKKFLKLLSLSIIFFFFFSFLVPV